MVLATEGNSTQYTTAVTMVLNGSCPRWLPRKNVQLMEYCYPPAAFWADIAVTPGRRMSMTFVGGDGSNGLGTGGQ